MGWIGRLRSHFREDQLHRDIADDIQAHLELRTRDNIAQGMPAEEARRAARVSFGNLTVHAEQAREAEIIHWLDTLWQNLRHAVRVLLKNPVSTAAAVISIAIGIGANTAVFSLMNAVMLKTLPVSDPQQIVGVNYVLDETAPPAAEDYSIQTYRAMRDAARPYIDLWASVGADPVLSFGDVTAKLRVEALTGNYYPALRAQPYLGRLINPADDNDAGPHRVAVLTYHAWRSQFRGDPTVVGKSILLNGTSFLVIGVEPSRFSDSPLSASIGAVVPYAAAALVSSRDSSLAFPAGRLRPGVSARQAEDALTAVYRTVAPNAKILLEPGMGTEPYLRDRYRKPLSVLMAAVSLVLLIACANVANLLLARGATRRRELAVRMAIGASRSRIVAQLLTESLLIAVCGAVLGIALAYLSDAALLSFVRSPASALPVDISPDWRVLGFTTAAAILSGLFFGLFPAFQAVRMDMNPSLRLDRVPVQPPTLRRILVVLQVALSLMLVAGAGLFGRSLLNLRTMDSGYDRKGVLLATVDASNSGCSEERLPIFFNQLLDRVRAIPGVAQAAFSSDSVLTGAAIEVPLAIDGRRCEASMTIASDGYTETMRIALLAGRTLSPSDMAAASAPVMVINQALARTCFGEQNPLGRRVRWGNSERQIVGVVRNGKYRELREEDRPMCYIPPMYQAASVGISGVDLHIRTTVDPQAVIAPLRRELRALSPLTIADNIRTLEEQSERSLATDRLLATLSEAFGAIALALAVVGIYGVLAFMVTRRTQEIGIRMALGARRGDVLMLVLRESLLLAAAGAAIGAFGAHLSRRLIQGLLYGVNASDERTTALAAAILLGTALLAALLPARRAARIDPMAALRQD
jgi:predicted permease